MKKDISSVLICETSKWNKEAIESILKGYRLHNLNTLDYKEIEKELKIHSFSFCIIALTDEFFDFNRIAEIISNYNSVKFMILAGRLSFYHTLKLASGIKVAIIDENTSGLSDMTICMNELKTSSQSSFCPAINERVLDYLFNHNTPSYTPNINLSKEEKEVLSALGEGKTTESSAIELNLTNSKVTSIKKRLLVKFKCNNFNQLVKVAAKANLI